MALMRPPERILFQHLILLELRSNAPAFVIGQSVPILLKKGVDSWNTPVPAVLQVFQSQTSECVNGTKN